MEIGDLISNRYKLLQRIGTGPLAIVYKAQDTALDRLVAVKVLRPEFAAQQEVVRCFQQEAQRAAEISHPNLVALYALGNMEDAPYLVAEYLSAGSLWERLDREGALAVDEALAIAIAVATGVEAYHIHGLLHGDLKPQNVLFTKGGGVKVADGGMGRVLEAALVKGEAPLREPVAYLTPEEVAGQPLTPASDVYALGLIFYEMLTGHPPFLGDSPSDTALFHLRQDPPPIQGQNPRVPAPLARIVHKMLAKDPRGRYPSAQQLHQILLTYQRQRAELSRRTTPTPVSITNAMRAVREPLLPSSTSEEQAKEGMDWLFILLGLLAVLAILGLVVLWTIVYRSYTMPLG